MTLNGRIGSEIAAYRIERFLGLDRSDDVSKPAVIRAGELSAHGSSDTRILRAGSRGFCSEERVVGSWLAPPFPAAIHAAGEKRGHALAAGTPSTKRHGVHDLFDNASPNGLQRFTGVLARLMHDHPVAALSRAGWDCQPRTDWKGRKVRPNSRWQEPMRHLWVSDKLSQAATRACVGRRRRQN